MRDILSRVGLDFAWDSLPSCSAPLERELESLPELGYRSTFTSLTDLDLTRLSLFLDFFAFFAAWLSSEDDSVPLE